METNPVSSNYNVEQKYNPLKDSSFWVAFVLGGGFSLIMLGFKGIFTIFMIPALFVLITWESVIILRKGKEWSLAIGFIFAFIIGITVTILVAKINSARQEAELEKNMKKYEQLVKPVPF